MIFSPFSTTLCSQEPVANMLPSCACFNGCYRISTCQGLIITTIELSLGPRRYRQVAQNNMRFAKPDSKDFRSSISIWLIFLFVYITLLNEPVRSQLFSNIAFVCTIDPYSQSWRQMITRNGVGRCLYLLPINPVIWTNYFSKPCQMWKDSDDILLVEKNITIWDM